MNTIEGHVGLPRLRKEFTMGDKNPKKQPKKPKPKEKSAPAAPLKEAPKKK